MQLESLCVIHVSKKKHTWGLSVNEAYKGALFLETCQRWLWISSLNGRLAPAGFYPGAEVFTGIDAYRFLLRIATGLESVVIGETDVFGQLKDAWKKRESMAEGTGADIRPWMERLFEDTKEIRKRFLENLGGNSYGSLVRKWIKNQCIVSAVAPRIFVVGAGQLAQTIIPYLLDFELLLWNRSPKGLSHLYRSLHVEGKKQKRSVQVHKIEKPEDEIRAWKEASHIIMCVPFSADFDRQRREWFCQGNAQDRFVLHLGGMREHTMDWNPLPQFSSLSHLFEFQDEFGSYRATKIAAAERACDERAKLRMLGASLSISHGWEDLANFA